MKSKLEQPRGKLTPLLSTQERAAWFVGAGVDVVLGGGACMVFRHRDPSAYSTSCRSKQTTFPPDGLGNKGEAGLLVLIMR